MTSWRRDAVLRLLASVTCAAACLVSSPGPAAAGATSRGPVEWIEVGDPILAEFDLLFTSGLVDSAAVRWTRPLARRDAAWIVARARQNAPGSRDPSLVRLERYLGRDLLALGYAAPPGYTAPLATLRDDPPADDDSGEPMQLRLSAYVDATLDMSKDLTGFEDRSRFGGRLDVAAGGLLAHLDVWAGKVEDAEQFTDVLITNSEFAAHSEDAYVSFATRSFDATFGRRRQAYGPGATGTLLWSRQAAPVTELSLGATLFRHLRASSVHGDVDASRDARIAAHRLEWFPHPGLTVAVHEAVRYTSSHWEPLYVVPILPFTFLQRLQSEDAFEGDGAAESVRNNVMGGLDVTWRPMLGMELAGELLLDDQNLKSSGTPTRIGYQLGAVGVTGLPAFGDGARGTARLEFSRVYNYVYSTFYGENFIHHGRPIGYPVGPDSRSMFASVAVATSPAVEGRLAATWTDLGEGSLGTFWDPDSGAASGSTLSGVVEHDRTLEGGVRFWPRDGIDVDLAVGHQWIDDAGHQAGVDTRRWIARLSLRLRK